MTYERQQVLDKIDKLLALGQSPNEHEATLALSRAQELLDKYNLSVEDILPTTKESVTDSLLESFERKTAWHHSLLHSLSKAFDCRAYAVPFAFRIVGHPQNIEACKLAFDSLRPLILSLADADVILASLIGDLPRKPTRSQKLQWKEGFCRGCSKRIVERIVALRNERLSQDVSCRALVVRHMDEVNDYCERKLNLHPTKGVAKFSPTGFSSGQGAADHICLHKQIR